MNTSFRVEVGRLLCGSMRDMLESEKVCGRDIRWHESSGFISRTFTIAGAPKDIAAIETRVRYCFLA